MAAEADESEAIVFCMFVFFVWNLTKRVVGISKNQLFWYLLSTPLLQNKNFFIILIRLVFYQKLMT